jgi:hypothetical protein
MSHSTWFFLGSAFESLKEDWIFSTLLPKCTLAEKEDVEDLIREISNKVIEEIWTKEDVAFCVHAIQQLKLKIKNLQEKYKDRN